MRKDTVMCNDTLTIPHVHTTMRLQNNAMILPHQGAPTGQLSNYDELHLVLGTPTVPNGTVRYGLSLRIQQKKNCVVLLQYKRGS